MVVVREIKIAVAMVVRAEVFIILFLFSQAVKERVRVLGRQPDPRGACRQTTPSAITLVAVKHGTDGWSIGEKLDKSLDLQYIRGDSQNCKSFGSPVGNRLSPLLMTLQPAAVVYVLSRNPNYLMAVP
jgi:hypothetical protein